MASASQINANRENAQKSSGPTSEEGKQTSSQNRRTHGLTSYADFFLMENEDAGQFAALCESFIKEHQPHGITERCLVRRLAEHQWLISRAMRFQQHCLFEKAHVMATTQFGVYMRYQTTHERAFYRALKELRTITELRIKHQIGFESQKQKAHTHNLKQLILIEKLKIIKSFSKSQDTPSEAPIPQKTTPGEPEKAA